MKQRRSVSSLIEGILSSRLKGRMAIPGEQERRRFPRKKVNITARIEGLNPGDAAIHEGAIVDLSLSGVRLSVPDSLNFKLMEDRTGRPLSMVFTLPQREKTLGFQCMPKYAQNKGTETHIGASFTNADFTSYQTLQDFLID
jgi:hypothetical protein